MSGITASAQNIPYWIETKVGGTVSTFAAMVTVGLIEQFGNGDPRGLAFGTIIGAGLGVWQLAPEVISSLWKR